MFDQDLQGQSFYNSVRSPDLVPPNSTKLVRQVVTSVYGDFFIAELIEAH